MRYGVMIPLCLPTFCEVDTMYSTIILAGDDTTHGYRLSNPDEPLPNEPIPTDPPPIPDSPLEPPYNPDPRPIDDPPPFRM